MVVCFECSRQTKEQLDRLVESGGFSDLSEAIAVAIANQTLLSKSASNTAVVMGTSEDGNIPRARFSPRDSSAIPGVFVLHPESRREPIAPLPNLSRPSTRHGQFSQANWI